MPETILNPEIIKKENAGYLVQISDIVEKAKTITIASRDQYAEALDFCKVILNMRKSAVATKEKLKRPALDFNKAVDEQFNAVDKPLAEVEGVIKKKLLNFDREEELKAAEAERLRKQAEEKALADAKTAEEANNPVAAEALLEIAVSKSEEVVAPAQTGAKTDFATGFKKKGPWKVEVLDLSKVDRRFLILDESLVKKAAAAGETNLSGLKVWQEDTFSIR